MNRGISIRKRNYSEEFSKYGFTFIVHARIEKPKCVICNEIMSGESMKPNKMKRHFDAKHPYFAGKDVQYLKNKGDGVKKSRLDFGGKYQQQNMAAIEAFGGSQNRQSQETSHHYRGVAAASNQRHCSSYTWS